MARSRARALFWALVAVQLLVLYWPQGVGPSTGLPLDKPVHALVFGAVLWAGVRAGVPTLPLTAALLLHAGLSEVLQAQVLSARSGDLGDVLADVCGVLLALLLVRVTRTRPVPGHSRGLSDLGSPK